MSAAAAPHRRRSAANCWGSCSGRAPMTDKATALTVSDVSKRFGRLVAVNGMSFELKENEVLGLIGPNGSGKTTMINLMSGAFSPTSGEIRLYDQTISGLSANQIAIAGLSRTFQIVRMLPSLTVIENVCAGGVFGHKRLWGQELHDYARALLQRVGLQGADNVPVSTLTYIDQ